MKNDEFSSELDMIKNPETRNIVESTLEFAPDYFWTCSASSTGLYHPKNELGNRGTVIHTHKVVKIAVDLCYAFDLDQNKVDIIIAASLLHDICKFGYPENNKILVSGHGNLVAHVMKMAKQKSPDIMRIISTHMGRWDTPFEPPTELLPMIMHLADYIASREYINIDYKVKRSLDTRIEKE
jgi:HD superfamily phosphohydrolase YqeK